MQRVPRRLRSILAPVKASSHTLLTSLSGGLRVATERTPGYFSAIGLFLQSGSRYEGPHTEGSTSMLERMAFKSTASYTTHKMMQRMDELGGNMTCMGSRETVVYQATCEASKLRTVLRLLHETAYKPELREDELESIKEDILFEIEDSLFKPDIILNEMLHVVAFGQNALGHPLIPSNDTIATATPDRLRTFMKETYSEDRAIVVATGVEHARFVDMVQELNFNVQHATAPVVLPSSYFSSLSSSGVSPSGASSSVAPARSVSTAASPYNSFGIGVEANPTPPGQVNLRKTIPDPLAPQDFQYTGGERYLRLPEMAPTNLGPQESLTHVFLGFPGVALDHPDVYVLSVLQYLMGGGGAFSAGGPGKGMYSRLFTRILNRHAEVESILFCHYPYSDSGIFGISASCHPSMNPRIFSVLMQEMRALTRGIPMDQLKRAKNQVKSTLLMNLESRVVQLEDIGRQVMLWNHRVLPEEMIKEMDKVTADDIKRVVSEAINGGLQPTLVAAGSRLQGLESLRDLV